jgi:hypothetical protein
VLKQHPGGGRNEGRDEVRGQISETRMQSGGRRKASACAGRAAKQHPGGGQSEDGDEVKGQQAEGKTQSGGQRKAGAGVGRGVMQHPGGGQSEDGDEVKGQKAEGKTQSGGHRNVSAGARRDSRPPTACPGETMLKLHKDLLKARTAPERTTLQCQRVR